MEVGEQQEGVAMEDQRQKEEVEEMEVEVEQKEEREEEEQEEKEEDALVEKEAAVMELLPVEVETDKARSERETAPDNAEERVVHEATEGLGFGEEKAAAAAAVVRASSDGEESREVGLDGAGEAGRNGTESQAEGETEADAKGEGERERQPQGGGEKEREGEGEGERQAQGEEEEERQLQGEDIEGKRDAAVASIEIEMVDAAAAVEDGEGEGDEGRSAEEKPAGVEANGARRSIKRKGSAALDDADGTPGEVVVKKPKKKTNVWSKSTTRKTSRKSKPIKIPSGEKKEECVEVNPTQRYLLEDRIPAGIQLSKDQKAEKVELSADKMQASSEKGYRMVRATRGVTEGAWYYEISVKDLGKTGHTRLGWSTWKGDLQAPVGFDANSYAFRDVDGSKVHQATREPYSSAYVEGDVIGFYISLLNGAEYAPKYDLYVNKATRTVYPVPVEKEEGPLKCVPGSEISFFKNGVCQGVAFSDIFAGEYFPAASMYTLPSPEKKCSVRFNFGPNFQFPITDWGERPVPLPMSQAPPPEGYAADIEEPAPADDKKEPKKSDTASNAGGKQRMAAERGNGSVEGRIPVGVGSGGVRTKRATDDKEKSKRPGLAAKKLATPKSSKKTSLPPRPTAAKSPLSEASLQIEVNLEGCSNDGSEVGRSHEVVEPSHEVEPGPGNSSDTETD